ncbi:hypothetical protein PoMZ_07255 [Pyricularia oryzae]|uniref:Uncharacterized protein n=1 Tax=Pyricularia oryzae TaxID=318829 RepID=A0A4P7NEN9_PYROR|nr:hypothetical protein PoMZ_07255 [Pyricularia oryzae]
MAPTSLMADAHGLLLKTRQDGGSALNVLQNNKGQPLAGTIFNVALALISTSVLSALFTMRANAIKTWKRLPFVVWILFFIYVDSYMFVLSSAIIQYGIGININLAACDAAIIVCLVFYVTTKAVYLFLVEKAYIIRGTRKGRLQSKLYLFNSFGMMGIYVVVVVLNFVFRINRLEDGTCIIGMKKIAMIPLISFDALVNVYLTFLFLIPLMRLYSFRNPLSKPDMYRPNVKLRTVAVRTFIGACCTLASSIVNLTVLMVLNGEPGWVCLMCCNSDILFSALVLYWITSKDNIASNSSSKEAVRNESHPLSAPERRSHSNSSNNNNNNNNSNNSNNRGASKHASGRSQAGGSCIRGSRRDSADSRAAYVRQGNIHCPSCAVSVDPVVGLPSTMTSHCGKDMVLLLPPHARPRQQQPQQQQQQRSSGSDGSSTEKLHRNNESGSVSTFGVCDNLDGCVVHDVEDSTTSSAGREGTVYESTSSGGIWANDAIDGVDDPWSTRPGGDKKSDDKRDDY